MNDAANPDILNRLADIELPAPPDWQPLLVASGAIIVALMLIIFTRMYIRYRKTSRTEIDACLDPALAARLKLQQLVHDWQSHTISDREAAYRLTTLLRLGLDLSQLTPACPPHIAVDQHAWQDTVRLCANLRYQETSALRLTPEIFHRVEQWLVKSYQSSQHNGRGV